MTCDSIGFTLGLIPRRLRGRDWTPCIRRKAIDASQENGEKVEVWGGDGGGGEGQCSGGRHTSTARMEVHAGEDMLASFICEIYL